MCVGKLDLPTVNIVKYLFSLLNRVGSFDVLVDPCHYMIFESSFYQLM